MTMKIEDAPVEIKDKAEFACMVCRAKYKAETGKADNCSCRKVLNEYCPYIDSVLKEGG